MRETPEPVSPPGDDVGLGGLAPRNETRARLLGPPRDHLIVTLAEARLLLAWLLNEIR